MICHRFGDKNHKELLITTNETGSNATQPSEIGVRPGPAHRPEKDWKRLFPVQLSGFGLLAGPAVYDGLAPTPPKS